jgi:glycosyltransferase involved in cell wall biosynthesis
MFPKADIFTHVYVPEAISPRIRSHRIQTTLIAKLPFASKLYKRYLPLMPFALEQLDLCSYDLVISSESGPAKGVLTKPDTLHICYCHSPMRYLWHMYNEYNRTITPLLRPFASVVSHWLRLWDYQTAARVDVFVANSQNVAQQIAKYYGRQAHVVPPPVDINLFRIDRRQPGEFYLSVGQLVRYKRVDLAIEAFNHLKRHLIVIGYGDEYKRLKRLAGPTIRFLGRQPTDSLRDHYARCRALVFPGEEDFGIVIVEAMAAGKPVIAYRRGGALDSVVDGSTGIFFGSQTVEAIVSAIARLEAMEDHFEPSRIAKHAQRFSRENFKSTFGKIISDKLNDHLSHRETSREH